MKEFYYTVKDPIGMHARPATQLVNTVKGLASVVTAVSYTHLYFDQSPEDAWKYCRDSLQQLGAYCEKKNVELMLEELKVTTTNVDVYKRQG